jgi:hypothetical protein
LAALGTAALVLAALCLLATSGGNATASVSSQKLVSISGDSNERSSLWKRGVRGDLIGQIPLDAPFSRGDASRIPALVLWAWERPEDLSFIDPAEVGVAYLAKTVRLAGDHLDVRPRLQPLVVPPGTAVIAVVRIETRAIPTSPARLAEVVAEILEAARRPGLAGLQIDFDARRSERSWYRALLEEARAALPPSMPLSITALASWCLFDEWLGGAPVDEVVPMVFRMGADADRVRRALANAGRLRSPSCRDAVGLATDEPVPPLPPPPRVYLFHPRQSWNEAAFAAARARVGY